MGIGFANPMGMGMGMGMIFENGYGCGYSSTRPVPAPRPSLERESLFPFEGEDLWFGVIFSLLKFHPFGSPFEFLH